MKLNYSRLAKDSLTDGESNAGVRGENEIGTRGAPSRIRAIFNRAATTGVLGLSLALGSTSASCLLQKNGTGENLDAQVSDADQQETDGDADADFEIEQDADETVTDGDADVDSDSDSDMDVDSDTDSDHDTDRDEDVDPDLPICTSDDECADGLACEGDDCIDLHCIVDEGELSSSNDVGPDCDTTGCNEALDAEERCGCTDRGRTNLNATSCAEREECNPDTGACEPVPCVPCCGITEGTWSGLITLGADRVTSAYDFGGYRPFYTNHGTFGRTLVVRRVSDNFPVGEIAVLYNATLTISNDANCMRVEVDTGSLFDGSLLDITERRVIRILP